MWHKDDGRVEHMLAEVSRIEGQTRGMKDQGIKDLRFTRSDRIVKEVVPNCIRKVVSTIAHYHFPPTLQMHLGWMLIRLGAGFSQPWRSCGVRVAG
jgi:hypothetical protein